MLLDGCGKDVSEFVMGRSGLSCFVLSRISIREHGILYSGMSVRRLLAIIAISINKQF